MLSDEQNRYISDIVYDLDYKKSKKVFKVEDVLKYYEENDNLGRFKIIKIEDNQENGMQAMAVAPIGADC